MQWPCLPGPRDGVGQQEGRLLGVRLKATYRPVCTWPLGVAAEWVEDGEKGCRWDVRREGFFHRVSGKGEMAKGDYCFEERGRSRCGAEASPRHNGGGALGRRGVKNWAGAWGGVPGRPRPPGQPRARSRGAGSGCPAQLPREPGAGAACPGPVGLGLRAAGRGEENNRRGGREREGAGARDAGADPAWTDSAR